MADAEKVDYAAKSYGWLVTEAAVIRSCLAQHTSTGDEPIAERRRSWRAELRLVEAELEKRFQQRGRTR